MNRESESRLVAFCVAQHGSFEPGAWSRFSAVSPAELAAVARYLAGVEWYGQREALASVATAVHPGSLAELVRETNFDVPRFAGLLRAHLHHARRLTAV